MKKAHVYISLLWVGIIVILVGVGCYRSYESKSLIYWQSEKYVFSQSYAESLPEEVEYLGQAVYKQYRTSLGEELTCDLSQISSTSIEMIESEIQIPGEECGNVYLDSTEDVIYIAVNTALHNPAAQRYYLFYKK